MKLSLLPLQNDDLIRLRCDGPVSRRGESPDDPLQALLGPHCYSHKVLLSLERCQAMDTSGLSWLMQSHKRFQETGGKLVLYGVAPVVLDLLDFVRLTPLLPIAASEQAASVLAREGNQAGDARPSSPALRLSAAAPR